MVYCVNEHLEIQNHLFYLNMRDGSKSFRFLKSYGLQGIPLSSTRANQFAEFIRVSFKKSIKDIKYGRTFVKIYFHDHSTLTWLDGYNNNCFYEGLHKEAKL
jgi:hypothetical protein